MPSGEVTYGGIPFSQVVCTCCQQDPCICAQRRAKMMGKLGEIPYVPWWMWPFPIPYLWADIITKPDPTPWLWAGIVTKPEPTPWNRFVLANQGELIQRVVNVQEVNKYLADGWVFIQELKSGDILIEKLLDTAKIAEAAIAQEKQRLQKI